MIGFIWFVVSVGLIAVPILIGAGGQTVLFSGGAGLVSLVLGAAVIVVMRLYVKTSAHLALFRTGAGNPKVVIDGGCLVVPVVHELTRVLLQTMKLEVVRQGPEALICKDFLRVDVAAEFYIRVNKNEGGVKAAATTLGHDAMNPDAIKSRLMEKLISALRTVAATMDLNELHQNREDFAVRVQEAVTKDIEPNGYILETVTISQLDQTDVKNLKQENVFDAQGLRKATEITQHQRVAKNKYEREAELAITEENVATRKRILAQEQDQEFAEADKAAEVENRRKMRDREIREFQVAQEELVEKRAVEKDRMVRATEIQRETALVEEQQKRETAEVQKQQAIEVASREREIAVAEAEGRRAEAEAHQRLAEAKAQEAKEKVTTAAEVEVAHREKAKAVIKAEQDGEQQLIEQQKSADAAAYKMIKQAEAQREAAEAEAQAKIRLAEAALEAKRREAEGDEAVAMVPVKVESERVKIESQRVEVLRQELEAKDRYKQAAIHLELARRQIDAGKEVGVAMANAIGKFMAQGQFQIFGDPATLADMTNRFSSGLGLTEVLTGLKEGNPLLGSVVESGLEAAEAGLAAVKASAKAKVAASRPGGEADGPKPRA